MNNVTMDFGYLTNFTIDQIFWDFRKKMGYRLWLGYIMTIGPEMALRKDVDVSKIDAKDWPVGMEQMVNKWIDDNPEKGKKADEESNEVVKKYKKPNLN